MNQYVINRTVPTLVWGREDDDFHTRISLFNYYSLLFPDQSVRAIAHLYLFGEDGQELGHVQKTLNPLQQWQYDLSKTSTRFQGSIGVQLVPDYLPSLSNTIGFWGPSFLPPIGTTRDIVILPMKPTGCGSSRILGCSTSPPPSRPPRIWKCRSSCRIVSSGRTSPSVTVRWTSRSETAPANVDVQVAFAGASCSLSWCRWRTYSQTIASSVRTGRVDPRERPAH